MLKSEEISAAFDVIEVFVDESHIKRRLVKCKECGQLYFDEFYEEIDWLYGDDPQYITLLPVSSKEDIEKLKKASVTELTRFTPRLQKDFPKDADKPKVYWIGK